MKCVRIHEMREKVVLREISKGTSFWIEEAMIDTLHSTEGYVDMLAFTEGHPSNLLLLLL